MIRVNGSARIERVRPEAELVDFKDRKLEGLPRWADAAHD